MSWGRTWALISSCSKAAWRETGSRPTQVSASFFSAQRCCCSTGKSARDYGPAQFILLIPATIALTSLLGYVYGVGALYGLASYIPMALPTAVAFLVLSLGVLLARPARGLTAVVSTDGPGGVLARRLLPAAILVPAFLGWLGLVSEHRGLLPTELGLAMMVVLTMLLFAALIWATSRSLNRADLARQAGERRVATQYATTYVLAQAADPVGGAAADTSKP